MCCDRGYFESLFLQVLVKCFQIVTANPQDLSNLTSEFPDFIASYKNDRLAVTKASQPVQQGATGMTYRGVDNKSCLL